MEKTIPCNVSKHGLPTLAESGGGKKDIGYACIIANQSGNRKKAIYIFKNPTPNGEHALFVIKQNDLVIEVSHVQKKFTIDVFRVKEIDIKKKEVVLLLLETSPSSNSIYSKPISMAIRKSQTLYCKEVMYSYSENKELEKKLFATN
jgi:hypothetical protein